MNPLTLVLLCVVIAVGIIIVVLLLFYFIGNIYNGLVRRRIRVRTSWYEINKLFVKFFELLPETIKCISNKGDQEVLRTAYQKYHEIQSPDDITAISNLFFEIHELLKQNPPPKENSSTDSETFLSEYISKISFSIPLYNDNVSQYNHFRRLPVNNIMAYIFKFKAATFIRDKNFDELNSKN